MNLAAFLFVIVNVLIIAIFAILLMFSNLTPPFTKKLLLGAAGMIALPLAIAAAGNAAGVLHFSLIDILLIREGSISLLITMSYGIISGVVMNKLWNGVKGALSHKKAQPEEQ